MIRYVSLTLVGIEKLNKDTDIFFFFKRVQNRLSQSVKDFIIFIVIRHIASRILTFSLGELTRKAIPFFQFFVQSLSTRYIESWIMRWYNVNLFFGSRRFFFPISNFFFISVCVQIFPQEMSQIRRNNAIPKRWRINAMKTRDAFKIRKGKKHIANAR